MHKILIIFTLFCILSLPEGFSQKSIRYYLSDTVYMPAEVLVIKSEQPNGKELAVYKDDTSKIAYSCHYYNGFINGVFTTFYKNGSVMEKIIYQKNKKNGEYTLYSPEGKVWIKGIYADDIKQGYWAYKTHNFYGRYKNGLKNGKWRLYYTTYSYYVYKYKNGKLLFKEKQLPEPPKID
jgi:antitoxin component YwqK of YwqJK toxin-antitoxin module